MTKPRKTKVDYFPHYVTHGATLFTIEERYQNDGYALWFKLLETLCNTESFCLDLNNTPKRVWFFAHCHLQEEKALEIINLLADLDAIDKEAWYSKKLIWIEKLIENLEPVFSRREGFVKPLNPLKGINASTYPTINSDNGDGYPIGGNSYPISKVKESEVNILEEVNSLDGFSEKVKTMIDLYTSNISVNMPPLLVDEIKDVAEKYELSWFEYAVSQAAIRNKRSFSYIHAILENCADKGYIPTAPPKDNTPRVVYKELD